MPRSGFASRRGFVCRASLITAGAILLPDIGLAQTSGNVVETAGGRVRGLTIDGIKWFRGIPYGADTGGVNRFMPPQKVAAWSGVRDCTNWGYIAPQHINPNPSDYTRYVRWNNYRGGMSEDCLLLNVWTPATGDNSRRAVMFIIHGGGYTSGSGNLEAIEGQHLARLANMVVVTVNHRLGMLGFCDLSAFGPAGLESSGNAGMMDLVLALEWVRDNIAQFGGDPGNVTITGQSGGGGKCSHLMAMPSAKGLFHKVAIQSGSALKTGRHEERRKDIDALCAKLGVPKGDLAKLQAVPFQQIVDSQTTAGPVLDGKVIPRDPFDPDAPAISASVPMIIGSCLDDWGFNINENSDDDASIQAWLRGQLRGTKGEARASEILALYRKDYPKENGYLLRAMMATDHTMRHNAIVQAERKAAQGAAPVYMYRWDWPADGIGAHWGAVHGTDLSPAFANPTTPMTGNTPQGKLLARQLGSSFAAFAKTGNPNNTTIPAWKPYDVSQRPVMVFGAETGPVNDPSPDLRQLWDQILSV
ncbi:MAG TPA: carboxylesterase family protein [Rhizomicrobium sp.]|nr:carboxylesterase family protein [Rhizomicrobium sp.]